MIWLSIQNSNIKQKLGIVYMPQESRTRVETLKEIYETIETQIVIAQDNGESLIIAGDLNCKIGRIIENNNEMVTKGGRILNKLMKKHNLTTVNQLEQCDGMWTRIEGDQKSIIDYVIVSQTETNLVSEMTIDEHKYDTPYRLVNKERVYTDHCMITVKLNLMANETKQSRYFNTIDKNGLQKFRNDLKANNVSNIIDNSSIIKTYTKWNNKVLEIRDKCYKRVKLKKPWKVERQLTTASRKIKRKLKDCQDPNEIKELKQQRNIILEQIEKQEHCRNYRELNKIIEDVKKEGGVNGSTFWKVRRKMKRNQENAHAIKDKNGELQQEKSKIKEVYKSWYEELLSVKEADSKPAKDAEDIVNQTILSMSTIAQCKDPIETNMNEIDEVIKKLDTKKASDMDSWSNKLIVNGGDEIRNSIHKIFNQVDKQGNIPTEWKQMAIRVIHKKGDITSMSNKRGLFLTSNISKLYERVKKNRNDVRFRNDISEWQTGGIKGRSPVDNVFTILSVIEMNRYLERDTYLMVTDAEKCFDNLQLDDGTVELWRCGTDIRDCIMINKLNAQAEITVRSPAGDTDPINLTKIVRQGTVYGPQICISSMDKINSVGKDIITPYSPNLDIKAVVFIDDICGVGGHRMANNLITNCSILEQTKKMTFNNKNGKTEYLIIKTGKNEINRSITSQVKKGQIMQVGEHSVLGTWLNETGTYEVNITKKKEKLPFMIYTVKKESHPKNMGELAAIGRLKLTEVVIIPSVLYNIEAFHEIKEHEIKELDRMQKKVLTEVLELPVTTPYYPLLMETGIWPIRHRIAYKKLMLYHNIIKSDEKRVIKKILQEQIKLERNTTWYASVMREINKYQIKIKAEEVLKSVWKKNVKDSIRKEAEREIRKTCSDMTKARNVMYSSYERKKYIEQLPLHTVKNILKTRLHMNTLPGNYKGTSVKRCPLCNSDNINLEHYIQCRVTKRLANVWNVKKSSLDCDDIPTLIRVSQFAINVSQIVEPAMKIQK